MKRRLGAVVAALLLWSGTSVGAPQARGDEAPRAANASGEVPTRVRSSGDVRGFERAVRAADGSVRVRGRVGGSGTLHERRVIFTGVVAPGDSPGCLVSEGHLVFGSSATLRTEIGGLAPCTEHDRFVAGTSMTVQGARMEVILINGHVPAAGNRYVVLGFGNIAGSGFGTLDFSQALLPAPLTWDTSQLLVTGELLVIGPPPETRTVPLPLAALLALGGLLGALGGRTRFKVPRVRSFR